MVIDVGRDAREDFYARVYRQCFSPDGDWLVSVDSRRRLCVFSVSSALSARASASSTRPIDRILRRPNTIFALHSSHSVLLCGDSTGRLFAYDWNGNESVTSLAPSVLFDVDGFASGSNAVGPNEINSICSIGDHILYAGAGRYAVEMTDFEIPHKVIRSFAGHEDYINEVVTRTEHEFLSASEDGTVRLWDSRPKEGLVRTLPIAKHASLRANAVGKGVCALAVDQSFMVCGGDVRPSIWHLDSYSMAAPLLSDDPMPKRFTVASMNGERILLGGTSPLLFQFTYNGSHITSVETSSRGIYSIERNDVSGRQMTTVAGDSTKLDVFLNLGYVAFSFDTSISSEPPLVFG